MCWVCADDPCMWRSCELLVDAEGKKWGGLHPAHSKGIPVSHTGSGLITVAIDDDYVEVTRDQVLRLDDRLRARDASRGRHFG